MFCPNCGKECSPTDKFCLSCGAKISEASQPVQNNAATNTVNTPMQSSAPIPPEQPVVSPVQNTIPPQQPVSDVYGGGMYSSSPAYAGAAGAMTASRKKAGIPKFLIVLIVAVIVIAIGVGAFFFIRNKMKNDYLMNNPTKYVYSATETFLDNSNVDSDLYSILKESANQGTISAEISGQANTGTETKDINMLAQLAYDKKDKKIYYKIDGSDFMPLFVPGASGNLSYELYADSKRMDVAYDFLGQSGKYFVEMGKFREQAENSIFSPSKENVFNISKEQFDSFVDGFESAYHAMTDNSDNGIDQMTDSLIAKLEKDAKTTIESGSVKVGGKDISADIVTYTIDHAAMKAMLGDIRDEMVSYVQNHKDTFGGDTAEIEKSINDGMNQAISAFDSSENKNFQIELKVYLDSGKKELVKFELKLDGLSNSQSGNHFELIGEFSHDPDMNITFTLTDGHTTATVAIAKTVNGDVTRYNFDAGLEGSSDRVTASLEYNKSTKIFTIMAGGQTITGTFEINGKTATIGYDFPIPAESGKLHLKLDISSEAKINEINADKNFLLMTKEEFEQFYSSLNNAISEAGGMSGMGTIAKSAQSASLESDAAMLHSICTSYYSGVYAGVITTDDKNNDGSAIYAAAPKGATAAERKEAACNATIYDAMLYSGLTVDYDVLNQLGADKDGKIMTLDELGSDAKINGLSTFTTLGELYSKYDY